MVPFTLVQHAIGMNHRGEASLSLQESVVVKGKVLEGIETIRMTAGVVNMTQDHMTAHTIALTIATSVVGPPT